VMMPDVNNNDFCYLGRGSVEGLFIGAVLSEHSWFDSLQIIYCLVGAQIGSQNGVAMPHSLGGNHMSIEACSSGIVGLGSSSNVLIARIDGENLGTAIYDPHNYLAGQIGVTSNGSASYGGVGVNGGANLRVIDLHQNPGPVSSPQAAPATTVAWPNEYYRDAEITLSVSGGTLSALKTDAVSEILPASCTLYKFTVPAGHSYTPTYTGTLTHTVKLS